MSAPIIVLISFFSIYLISHFGGKVSAKNSPSWWLMLCFFFLAAIEPAIFQPLTHFLGIHTVSNFVIAAAIIFLFTQSLNSATIQTSLNQKLRTLVCDEAATLYLQKLGRSAPNPSSESSARERYLVLFPTFNEEESLPSLLRQIEQLKLDHPHLQIDFCFCDDGSSDRTRTILSNHSQQIYTFHRINLGVSGALLTGFKIARQGSYDFIVQCDADGQHPIDQIPRLLTEARRLQCDLLIGSRFFAGRSGSTAEMLESTTRLRRFGGILLRLCLLFFGRGAGVTDPTSGFRVYSQQACELLERSMPEDYPEPESVALLAYQGLRVAEVRVRMYPRTGGTSSISGWKSIQYMIKVLTAILALRIRTIQSQSIALGRRLIHLRS